MYKAFYGSLTKDDTVNEFLLEVDKIAAEFDAAVVMVHHTKKETRSKNGSLIDTTDADTYGSQFLLGAVDHLVRLEKLYKEDMPLDRFIRCDTQRSGAIVSDLRVRLCEPDPLYFYLVDLNESEKTDILALLIKSNKPVSISEMIKLAKISRTKIYQVLKTLQNEGKVVKSGSKIKYYEVRI